MRSLEIILAPGFLLLIDIAEKRWGPAISGWLAGLPAVTGPILFLLRWSTITNSSLRLR